MTANSNPFDYRDNNSVRRRNTALDRQWVEYKRGVIVVESKQDEPKLAFESAGEAVAYILLDQARVLAL